MYSQVGTRPGRVWPIAALCCLAIVLFLIAVTIVLALIPVYLPTKEVTVVEAPDDNSTLYVEYSADATSDTSVSGAMDNTDQLTNTLGLGSDAKVSEAYAQAISQRRKRSLGGSRQKRTLKINILVVIKYIFRATCNNPSCQTALRTRVKANIEKAGNVRNFPCQIRSVDSSNATITKTFNVDTTLIGFLPASTARLGFGVVTSLVFVATQSSDFNNPDTWIGGIIPFGQCIIVIPVGITVTISRTTLEVPVQTIQVYGTLALGSGGSPFIFNNSIAIFAYSGATIQLSSTSNTLLVPPLSIFTLYNGAQFSKAGVAIQTYTSASLGNSVTVASASGPLTVGILTTGQVLSFNEVTFIIAQSGAFRSGSTYLGGMTPSPTTCSASSACGLYIPVGITFTISSIILEVSIQTIQVYGTLALGAGGSPFTFSNSIAIFVYSGATIQLLSTSNTLLVPPLSICTLYNGAQFSKTGVVIQTYTSAGVGNSVTVASASGPLTIGILTTGQVLSFNEVTFIVAQSGAFLSGSTYLGGMIPSPATCSASSACGLYIPVGITVTISSITLEVSIQTIQVYGTLALGSGSSAFTFSNSIAIFAYSGATIQFLSTSNTLLVPPLSIFTLYNGAKFSKAGVVIQTYTSAGLGNSVTVASASGPLTVGILAIDEVLSFNEVTFIVAQSGAFLSGSTYLGGMTPSLATCSASSACGLYIPAGITFTISSITLEVSIQTIQVYGTLALGSGSSAFTFSNSIAIFAYSGATIQLLSTSTTLLVPPLSIFTLYNGATFSKTGVVIQTYTSAGLGNSVTVASASGPLTVGILAIDEVLSFSEVTFIVAQSGAFLSGSTYLGGMTPSPATCSASSACGLYIPVDITVTISSIILEVSIQTIQVYGTLALGSGSSAFTFNDSIAIFAYSGATIQLSSTSNTLLVPPLSIFTLYNGAQFSKAGVVIQTYTSAGVGNSVTVASASGPFTVGILAIDEVLSFNEVTFIVAQSGAFLSGSTYLGGMTPSPATCSASSACGLYIPVDITVTISSIILEVSIQTIQVYGTLALGSGSSAFTFNDSIAIFAYSGATIQFLSTSNTLLVPPLSIFTLYNGAQFSKTGVVIQTYTSAGVGNSVTVASASGPLTVGILAIDEVLSFNEVTFIVAQSGAFLSGSTYLGGMIPSPTTCSASSACGLYISVGITFTISSIILEVSIQTIQVYGTLALGSGSSAFTFNDSIAIFAYSGATIQFLSTSNTLLVPPLSIFTLYNGAQFSKGGVIIQTYTSAGLGNSVTVASASGPLTVGILAIDEVLSFNEVTFIVAQSGAFRSGSTYLGGVTPSPATCSASSACGLYIPVGITFTISSITLEVPIQTIQVYGALALGSGSSAFKFMYSIAIFAYSGATIQLSSTSNTLLVPPLSICTLYNGAQFSKTGVVIQTYTSAGLGNSVTVASASGPLTVGILAIDEVLSFNEVTFIVAQSGAFRLGSTYLGGMKPSLATCSANSACGLYIPVGITFTISRTTLEIPVETIQIYGTLALGSGSSPFTFSNSIAIFAYSGATIQLLSTSNTLLVPPLSIFTLYNGAQFSKGGVIIQTYTSAGLGNSVTVASATGPLTVGILATGQVLSFNEVTFIVAHSGAFLSGSTYLGGMVPSPVICSASSACGLYIPSGFTVTTADLNGVLNMNFDHIFVAQGATFSLGTPGSYAGFKFMFPVRLDVYGTLAFAAAGSGIFLPSSSAFNLYSGAVFTSGVATFLQVFNPATGAFIGTASQLGTSLSGPYFVTIATTGVISISTIAPGGSNVSSSSSSSVSPSLTSVTTTSTTTMETPDMNG